jgi:hypothetical protein
MSNTIFLIEVQGYNLTTNAVDTLYYGTADFVTGPSDSPADQYYEGRVLRDGRIGFSSNLFGNSRLVGTPTFNTGTIDLDNSDGALDGLDNYAFGGRSIKIFRVENENFAAKTTYISGLIDTATVSYDRVVIALSDASGNLRNDIQDTLYLGNNSSGNGFEGDADNIKGSPKPLAYGHIRNATPILVNHSRQIYQLHDGSIDSIANVLDGQTSFTFQSDLASASALQSFTVDPGKYATCLSAGLIKLANIPQRGLTVDFKGDNAGGYIDRAGEIVRRIVETHTDLTTADLDTASFTQFDADFNYETGIYITSRQKTANAISEVLGPLNFWTFSRSGVMSIGVFSLASGTPVEEFTIDETLREDGRPVSRVTGNDANAGVPVWRLNYEWGRNYTVQTRDNVFTSVSLETVAFTSREYRSTTESDTSVQTRYPRSPELTVTSQLFNEADANADRYRVHSLFKARNNFYRITVKSDFSSSVELNSVIRLTYPRFGLSAGKLLRVTGIRENASSGHTLIEAFG